MYLRESKQKRTDGSTLSHFQIAENVWDPHKKRSRVQILYNCGRGDDPKVAERLRRLACSIIKRCSPEEIVSEDPSWKVVDAWSYGDVYVLEQLWRRLGLPELIGELIHNNVTSAILFLRELVKRYRHEKVNVVVVMSTAAQVAKAGESTYCAAKWAVRGLIESVRLELKGSPMKLIAVYPGGMATDFWQTSGKDLDTSGFMTAEEAAAMLKQALVSAEHGYVSDITINRS